MTQPVTSLSLRSVFCAGHRLHSPHLSAGENRALYGKCNHESGHGHNYILHVTIKGPVDPKTGIVINFVDMQKIVQDTVIERIDHKFLNKDLPEFQELIPTAENIAIVCWRWLKASPLKDILYEVSLMETETNTVVYRGE